MSGGFLGRLSLIKPLLLTLLSDHSSRRFTLGVILGLAFSISVILGTFGIMDGFELTLKRALKGAVGDVTIHSTTTFFSYQHELQSELEKLEVKIVSPQVEVEAFAINKGISKGIKIIGVDPQAYSLVTGIELKLFSKAVVIGQELARQLNLRVGEMITLALAQGSQGGLDLPQLVRFKVSQIRTHGLHQNDLRLIYMERPALQQILGVGSLVNGVSLVVPSPVIDGNYMERITQFTQRLREHLDRSFFVRPFWHEFGVLLEAVRAERFMLGLILQIIVLIAVFNLLSYIIFISEKRVQELFLVKALGMGGRDLFWIWTMFILMVWLISSLLSVGMVALFNQFLTRSSLLEIPGEIYTLGGLSVVLDPWDYLVVFGLALFWIMLLSIPMMRRMGRRSIVEGLRTQFS
jgi:ABC-type lipoprotein release transport system permease subunit